jgi:serine/threonine protein kinase
MCQTNFLSAKNEVDMLVRLDHPNIVNIYEVFEEEDCIILILEYMEGGELYEAVGQRATFCESEVKYLRNHARNYMRILIDAIRYCHEMNVVHRDIKVELP